MTTLLTRENSDMFDKKIDKHFEWCAHPKELDTTVASWGKTDEYWYYGFNKRGKRICKMTSELYNTLKDLS